MLEIKKGKIFVHGVETIDPELIGFAVLDMVEENKEADHIGLMPTFASEEPLFEMDLVPSSEFILDLETDFDEVPEQYTFTAKQAGEALKALRDVVNIIRTGNK